MYWNLYNMTITKMTLKKIICASVGDDPRCVLFQRYMSYHLSSSDFKLSSMKGSWPRGAPHKLEKKYYKIIFKIYCQIFQSTAKTKCKVNWKWLYLVKPIQTHHTHFNCSGSSNKTIIKLCKKFALNVNCFKFKNVNKSYINIYKK